jgi:phosphoribosyl 1,2-cyclic phosphodiesterase
VVNKRVPEASRRRSEGTIHRRQQRAVEVGESAAPRVTFTADYRAGRRQAKCTAVARIVTDVRMSVLASGSKGNCTIVASARTRILVDAGLSCREILRRMDLAGEDPALLDAILITHEHQDHVAGLAVLARRLNVPVFFTEPTHRAWVRMLTPRTRMTYAQWLDQLRREREQRGSAETHMPAHVFAQSVESADFYAAQAGMAVQSVGPETADAASEGGDRAAGDCAAAEAFVAVAAQAAEASEELKLSAHPRAATLGAAPSGECVVALPEALATEAAATATLSGVRCDDPAEGAPKADPAFLPAVEYFQAGRSFAIGDIDIDPFTIPHDAADPCGFVFHTRTESIRMAIATDLGYIPPNVKMALRNADVLLLESNHDLEMLKDGPYPWSVKQRVLSRVGHLSNDAAAEFLLRDYDGGAHTIVLGHLSESNNLPELARMAAETAIGGRMSLLGNRLVLAGQHEPTARIEL